jgi:hypothetical protein
VLNDFEPVLLITDAPQLIVAKKVMPANDLKGLIAWLKANPDKASQGTSGVGSAGHVGGVFLQNITGARFQFVPYRGVAPAMQDLLAGQIDIMIDPPANSLPQVRSGNIKAFVHNHISFGYEHARPTRTAWETFNERRGGCRDYAHLAIAFCRCMNIPARYCTGYLGDMGVPPPYGPMDFAAWFEAYLGGRWYTFDARNNVPRIGRVLVARGRDAIDVAISTT